MRKIGLDVGDKTIGVAVSDALNITAQGITTIERVGIRKDAGKVMDYIKEYDCDTVVIGLPRRMDERVLIEADMRRNKRKQVIDKQAAVIILQSYLDSKC